MASRNLMLEISDLALRARENRLSVVQLKRLNELLEASDDACRALLLSGILDAELAMHSRAAVAQDRVLEAIGNTAKEKQLREPAEAFLPVTRSQPRAKRSWRWVVGGVAACAMVYLLYAGSNRRESSAAASLAIRVPQPIGSLKSAPDANFSGKAPRVGDPFMEGDVVILDSGEAHVSMASGAEFVLKGPAELRFDTSKHVELRRGLLTAHVAAWGSGFTVDTTAMRVVDLGTKFAVSASTEDVETHVLQGQVRVQPLASQFSGRRSVLLKQGEAIRVDSGADVPVRIA
ncbi:MAG TPA: FecR domain-containing protein, partial [Lacipirellulaceae bacterium]|nr:FecR domain-containing protein [Lacipirellulaceae bacterium]